jgi:hypothetical protein
MKKLEIGDKIYKLSDGWFNYRISIVRLTPTLAIDRRGDKFKINIIDGVCCKVPKDQPQFLSSKVKYLIETPELKNAFEKQCLVSKFKTFDFGKLNLETLLEIDNILKLIIK